MKRLILIAILVLMFCPLSLADFEKGNLTADIKESYSSGEKISGWINISLDKEPADSLISSDFEDGVSILELLENNLGDYSCIPSDCEDRYTSTNPEQSKLFTLDYGEKIISLKVQGKLNSVDSLSFDISVDNDETCLSPLEIDILNDGIIEWKAKQTSSNFGCIYEGGVGCFNVSEILNSAPIDDEKPYCEKIGLIKTNKFKIGAWIKKGSTSWQEGLIKMYLYDLSGQELANCDLPEPSQQGSEIGCEIDYENTEIQDFYVCIKAEQEIQGYETKIESEDSCGFYEFPGQETDYSDYHIFAKGAKYSDIGDFTFDQSEYESQGNAGELKVYISDYLDDKYNNNCSDGCSIPIKFKAYQNLDLEISNLDLRYSTTSSPKNNSLIYDSGNEPALVSSGFLKLDLEYSNLTAPSSQGNHTLEISLDNEEIIEQDIIVSDLVEIKRIIPNIVPAFSSVNYFAETTGNITSYKWDFGDNTALITTTNIATHTYTDTGTYYLTLTVEDKQGQEISEEFEIEVQSPEDLVNETLQEYKNKIDNIIEHIEALPSWFKRIIEEESEILSFSDKLDSLEIKYEIASTSQDYVDLMANLSSIEIPQSIDISESSSQPYLLEEDKINPSYLEAISLDTPEKNLSQYKKSIIAWFQENIDMEIKKDVYSLYYQDSVDELATTYKLTIKPKKDFDRDVYLIIEEDYGEITFKENYNERDTRQRAAYIKFSGLDKTQEKIIEFVVIGKQEIPIYMSPEFSKLPEVEIDVEPCNFNGRCEKELGENPDNCRADCKPWGWMIFWIILLLFLAFCAYIGMQEWYKRYYEKHLFKSSNDLYNLVNFVNNAFYQGLSKEEIMKKLKQQGWKSEQIMYAIKKVKGQRTGMWEIPVFKWLEKKKVKEEIEKRKQMVQIKGQTNLK
jgi:PKD repeat protein